jgi:hypothetical protein
MSHDYIMTISSHFAKTGRAAFKLCAVPLLG